MARSLLQVNLELDNIIVHDEGDGIGDAEPYLWTVFFKVDGHTVSVTDALGLSGPPTIRTTPGSHGNLGTDDADEGDNILIPSAIGEWQTLMSPIKAPPSLSSLFDDFAGIVGVVVVLMEEDNVSDDGADAGHVALNAAVRDALQEIIDTRSITNQDVTEEEIEGFTDAIQTSIKDAIKDQQNFFENFWSWLNPDDTIGTRVFMFNHDQLESGTLINFSQRWDSEGDWEIFGHVSSSVVCPGEALADFAAAFSDRSLDEKSAAAERAEFSDESGRVVEERIFRVDRSKYKPVIDLAPLREFRNGEYQQLPGLAKWFELLERHTPRLIRLAAGDKQLQESVNQVLQWALEIVQKPDIPISDERLKHAEVLLTQLRKNRSRRARIDASRALDVLRLLPAKTPRQAFKLLNEVQPARHPNIAGDPGMRIRPRKGGFNS